MFDNPLGELVGIARSLAFSRGHVKYDGTVLDAKARLWKSKLAHYPPPV